MPLFWVYLCRQCSRCCLCEFSSPAELWLGQHCFTLKLYCSTTISSQPQQIRRRMDRKGRQQQPRMDQKGCQLQLRLTRARIGHQLAVVATAGAGSNVMLALLVTSWQQQQQRQHHHSFQLTPSKAREQSHQFCSIVALLLCDKSSGYQVARARARAASARLDLVQHRKGKLSTSTEYCL